MSEVEMFSPVLETTSCFARSSRWRRASLIRTDRVCCCSVCQPMVLLRIENAIAILCFDTQLTAYIQ